MSAASSPAPETIANYVIEHALAQGSMGTVYVARHALTYARVALKVLRAELGSDAQAEERFLREVRAAARIGHDGIVKVQDAGRSHEGHLYLAMELLSGETLEQRIARSPGERLTAMEWLLAMLEPLAAAHENSIVHRDLKPANVFIAVGPDGSERIKLLDFGLARDTREKSGTQTGIALGTPYYMSPEQATRPKDISPASDVWSLGVMMYEFLTGSMPFDGETLHAVVIKAATMPHVPAAEALPGLHPELAALVDACLAKAPYERPRDASELRRRLAPLLADPAVRAELSSAAMPAAPAAELDSTPPEHIPFAETAIALAHDSRIQDIHRRAPRSHLGWWIASFAALALIALGALWSLDRDYTAGASELPARRVDVPELARPRPRVARAPQAVPLEPAAPVESVPPEPAAAPAPEISEAVESETAEASAANPPAHAPGRRTRLRGGVTPPSRFTAELNERGALAEDPPASQPDTTTPVPEASLPPPPVAAEPLPPLEAAPESQREPPVPEAQNASPAPEAQNGALEPAPSVGAPPAEAP